MKLLNSVTIGSSWKIIDRFQIVIPALIALLVSLSGTAWALETETASAMDLPKQEERIQEEKPKSVGPKNSSANPLPGFSSSLRVQAVSLWGKTTNETTFRQGMSSLEWPVEMRLLEASYLVAVEDLVELELSLQACPWIRSRNPMEDYDWLDESYYSGRAPHDGIDIYSESTIDEKAISFDARARIFALRKAPAYVGLFLAYTNQEMDFKAYDTVQEGYGTWSDRTGSVSGPSCTYTVEYDIYQIGLSWRFNASDILKVTLDSAFIPYVKVRDEDDHIRRLRISQTNCEGHGRMLAMTMHYSIWNRWFVSSSCTWLNISTNGSQIQYWYGNDPASNGDETGMTAQGIGSDIDQKTMNVGIAIGRTF